MKGEPGGRSAMGRLHLPCAASANMSAMSVLSKRHVFFFGGGGDFKLRVSERCSITNAFQFVVPLFSLNTLVCTTTSVSTSRLSARNRT